MPLEIRNAPHEARIERFGSGGRARENAGVSYSTAQSHSTRARAFKQSTRRVLLLGRSAGGGVNVERLDGQARREGERAGECVLRV